MSGGAVSPELLRTNPLEHLGWFTEWGGRSWERLTRIAFKEFLGTTLAGKHVLELGPRRGRMSCLFALLGARVAAFDANCEWLDHARSSARTLGVESCVEFIHYSGNLADIPTRNFDIVFTKSVLVASREMPAVVEGLHSLLKPGGHGVFIENALGGPVARALRRVYHASSWNYSTISYISKRELALIRRFFDVTIARRSLIPPVYLICAVRRDTPD